MGLEVDKAHPYEDVKRVTVLDMAAYRFRPSLDDFADGLFDNFTHQRIAARTARHYILVIPNRDIVRKTNLPREQIEIAEQPLGKDVFLAERARPLSCSAYKAAATKANVLNEPLDAKEDEFAIRVDDGAVGFNVPSHLGALCLMPNV
jgi:hypothetical protein